MQFTENKCPITLKSIFDLENPVLTPNGVTYEKEAIEEWIRNNGTDPITREPLNISQLVINRALIKENITISKNNETSEKDLTIVWDISGSMLNEATFVNDNGDKENSGLTYHDIVRHAITVIINVLSDQHRLSIVTFSTKAQLILPLTWMNDSGKEKALDKIKNIQASGCTDLWGGIFRGLQSNKHGEIYVLTDGIPSYEPPRGWNQQMIKYKSSHPEHSSVVKTFGFGYSLDSKLLHNIAHQFEGSFSFIPDAGFVGTVFIHSLVNSLISNDIKDDKKISDFLELLKSLNELSETSDLTFHRNIIKLYKECYPNGIYEEQIDIACSKDEYYQKWGKHYLRSLYDAHFYQECNNFKDQSVQSYATPEQKKLIDKADDIFCNLPSPEPTIPKNHDRSWNNNTNPSNISMRCFSQPTGGCFSGECQIETTDGYKLIKDLKKGELLRTTDGYSPLICLMKTTSKNIVQLESKINENSSLLVTEWHPIKENKKWIFPNQIKKSIECDLNYVYSLVVENNSNVYIEGWECITLGHGIINDPVASHSFWGTDKVIQCLQMKDGWNSGVVIIKNVVRNEKNEVFFLN